MVFNSITFVLIGILSLIYLYIRRQLDYWSKHNIPHIKPIFPYGNLKEAMVTKHFAVVLREYYDEMKGKGPFGGIHMMLSPSIVTLDLDFVRRVLIKDFNYFEDRGVYYNSKDDPLSAHLFSLEGKAWRKLRSKLSPTFTSGKMKFMYPTILEVADKFKNWLSETVDTQTDPIELKSALGKFTTDVIGTCAFGIECNSMTDQNSQFLEMGQKPFTHPRHHPMVAFLMVIFDDFARKLSMKVTSDDVEEFFMSLVTKTVEYREENNVQRNDFMDILIKLKNQKKVDGDDSTGPLSINDIAAQAFLFFLAGFETSSTTMTFCLYELAVNEKIQTKAREEIKKVLDKHNGQFTYEALMDMHYIEQIINEALRKYPPTGNLFRRVTKDFVVPEYNNFVLKKGMMVWIPIYGIQHDPEYYPNPENFDPERFSPDSIGARNPLAWLPFGDGQRNCIGLRFGMMQAKVGLVTMLQHFKLSLSSKTQVPVELSPTNFVLAPIDGLWLNVSKIE